jgi:hypothetical protein
MFIVGAPLWALSDSPNHETSGEVRPSAPGHRPYKVWFPISLAVIFGIVALGWYTVSAHKKAGPRIPHDVTLNWKASVSKVAGYKVYRALRSGGPYKVLQDSPITGTSYVDSTVEAGKTYFYVVVSVTETGRESIYSNEISVTVPSP